MTERNPLLSAKTTCRRDSLLVQSILAAMGADLSDPPEERARTLLFAWLLSLPANADVATLASELKLLLDKTPAPDNPLLPYLLPLLEDVRRASTVRRRRNRQGSVYADT